MVQSRKDNFISFSHSMVNWIRFFSSWLFISFKRDIRSIRVALYKNSPENAPKNVIYKIPCADCESCYVCKTTRHLNYRITEHKRDVRNKKKENAISKHVERTGHSIAWDNVKPISSTKNGKYLSAKENILITTTDRTVNYPDSVPHCAWIGILQTHA